MRQSLPSSRSMRQPVESLEPKLNVEVILFEVHGTVQDAFYCDDASMVVNNIEESVRMDYPIAQTSAQIETLSTGKRKSREHVTRLGEPVEKPLLT